MAKRIAGLFLFLLFIIACANKVLKYEKVEELKKIEEFDQQVKIVTPPVEPSDSLSVHPAETPAINTAPAQLAPSEPPVTSIKIKNSKKIKSVKKASAKHLPELESSDGFIGRRPNIDPFKVGEKILHDVTYMGMTAGSLAFEVLPFAAVNDQKSYQFKTSIGTKSIFAAIYAVDDNVLSLVDFDNLIPRVFTLHVKESKQLREARALFDQEKRTATYWEKKVTADEGEKEKKLQWEIPDYSQNVFSALYYLRTFQWELDKENAFRVADDGQNLIFKAKAIRKEVLSTDVGEFNTIVIKPEVQLQGVAKPVGDIFLWLSDDERKYILRVESKVKIGTLTSEVVSLSPGRD